MTAQGIRDALRYGRLLGEAAAPVLDDPRGSTARCARWARRPRARVPRVYQWTNRSAGPRPVPIEAELYRAASRRTGRVTALNDVFARRRGPDELLRPLRLTRLTATALARRGADRRGVVRTGRRELGIALRDRAERRGDLRTVA